MSSQELGSPAVRVPPLPVDQWAPGLLERTQKILGGEYRASANVYCTVANSPLLLEAWLHLGGHLLRSSSLDARDRELVILRATAVSGGNYPFAQHTRIGGEVGMSPKEIEAVLVGRTDRRWASIDRTMLTAVDELMAQGAVSDGVWHELADNCSVRQSMDLIALTAFYRMASWMLNLAQTPLDPGQVDQLRPVAVPAPSVSTRPDEPRLPPVPLERWPEDLLADSATWPRFAGRPEMRAAGVYATLANHPELFGAIAPLMAHLLVDHSLSDRHRELVIIRSCLLDRGEYPYRQHVRIGAEAGLDEDTIGQLSMVEPNLDGADGTMCALIDELHLTNRACDSTWEAVTDHFDVRQIFDAVVTAGFYGLISFVLNTAGTPLEAGEIELPHDLPVKEFS